MKKMTNAQYIEIHKKDLETMSNDTLFKIYEEEVIGDNYEAGAFTELGQLEFNETRRELMERLVKIGFLEKMQ